ncbi:MAG: single-stranded DNA-binding protein [Candidatus Gracilibacteria bacterium]
MRSINKVILIGNVTRDPEIRATGSGQTVATFTIATNRTWMTRDGRKMQSAEYHDVVAWAHLADICKAHIRKSKLLYIEGYLKTRSWDTPEGIRKFKTEIVINDLVMLDKREREEGDFSQEYTPSESSEGQESHDTWIDDQPAINEESSIDINQNFGV